MRNKATSLFLDLFILGISIYILIKLILLL